MARGRRGPGRGAVGRVAAPGGVAEERTGMMSEYIGKMIAVSAKLGVQAANLKSLEACQAAVMETADLLRELRRKPTKYQRRRLYQKQMRLQGALREFEQAIQQGREDAEQTSAEFGSEPKGKDE